MDRMNNLLFGKGKSPENAAESLSSVALASDADMREERPGHFTDLTKFMTCDDDDNTHKDLLSTLNDHLDWCRGHNASLTPRTIIYIKDRPTSTWISDRVMLVLRTNGQASVTCLTFCSHSILSLERRRTHRFAVTTGQASPQTPAPSISRTPVITYAKSAGMKLQNVEVDLLPLQGHACYPQSDVFLNCEELWNIECEVMVAVLGEVTVLSFKELVKHVKQLFSDSLDEAVKAEDDPVAEEPSKDSSTSKSAPVEIPKRHRDSIHGSGRKGKRYHRH